MYVLSKYLKHIHRKFPDNNVELSKYLETYKHVHRKYPDNGCII